MLSSPFLKDKLVLETEEIEQVKEHQAQVINYSNNITLSLILSQADIELKGAKTDLLRAEKKLEEVNHIN